MFWTIQWACICYSPTVTENLLAPSHTRGCMFLLAWASPSCKSLESSCKRSKGTNNWSQIWKHLRTDGVGGVDAEARFCSNTRTRGCGEGSHLPLQLLPPLPRHFGCGRQQPAEPYGCKGGDRIARLCFHHKMPSVSSVCVQTSDMRRSLSVASLINWENQEVFWPQKKPFLPLAPTTIVKTKLP